MVLGSPYLAKPPCPPETRTIGTQVLLPGLKRTLQAKSAVWAEPPAATRICSFSQALLGVSNVLVCFHHHRAPSVLPGPHREAGQQKALNVFYGLVEYSELHLLIMRCCSVRVVIYTFG